MTNNRECAIWGVEMKQIVDSSWIVMKTMQKDRKRKKKIKGTTLVVAKTSIIQMEIVSILDIACISR